MVDIYPENYILWWTKSSADSGSLYDWANQSLRTKIANLGKVHLYVWAGTCDLTTKEGKEIRLTDVAGPALCNLQANLKKFKSLPSKFRNLKVTLLETPYYSIEHYNIKKSIAVTEETKRQDLILRQQIDAINTKIRSFNANDNTRSPKFNIDTRWCRAGRHYTRFGLYKDGVHPDELLAKVWLKNLTQTITRDCREEA